MENKATEELDLVVTFLYISSSCLSRSVNKNKNFTLKALRLWGYIITLKMIICLKRWDQGKFSQVATRCQYDLYLFTWRDVWWESAAAAAYQWNMHWYLHQCNLFFSYKLRDIVLLKIFWETVPWWRFNLHWTILCKTGYGSTVY